MRRLLASLLAPLLAACAAPLPGLWPDRSQREYEAAMDQVPLNPEQARNQLRAFLGAWPRSSFSDDAGLALAQLEFEAGDTDEAVRLLEHVIERYPRGDRTDSARLLLAQVERGRGRDDAAYRVASGIRFHRLPPAERGVAYRLLAELAGEGGDVLSQFRWLGALASQVRGTPEAAAVGREIDEFVVALDASELDRAADRLEPGRPAARLRLRAAELALEEGALERAAERLEMAARLRLEPDEEARLQLLEARLDLVLGRRPALREEAGMLPTFAEVARLGPPDVRRASGTLGVVLPLTGPFARFGQASLRGIMLAAGIFDVPGGRGPGRVRLLVRDSGGDPATAAAAVESLADNRTVQAIIGPLLAEESEAAADAAEGAGVPLLSLTRREEVARRGDQVFRVGMTPRSEVAVLAEQAVHELGARRVAILYPRDAYGRGLKDLFWDAVEARGGTVMGVASYEPEATDFAEPIRRLIGFLLLTEEEQELLAERARMEKRAKRLPPEEAAVLREEAAAMVGPDGEPLPPLVDFDALFVPDTHSRVELIAPQLAFHDVRDVRLLGPSGWNHPDLVRIAGRHVEGAVFTEAFFGESRFGFIEDFTSRYEATFGEGADVIAAQSFDAANLVLIQLARGLLSRTDLREGLLATRGYPGVSGVTTFQPDGNALKRPFLLGVRGTRIVPLD